MITKANTSTVPHAPEGVCSVLISINTPGIESPVCRLGNSKVLLGELTVGQLIDKVINPNSLLSVGVPMAQLEAESPAAVAISELLSTDLCEVFLLGEGQAEMRVVSMEEPASSIAQPQSGERGNTFINVNLEVRAAQEVSPDGQEKRELALPSTVEVEAPAPEAPAETAQVAATSEFSSELPEGPPKVSPAPEPKMHVLRDPAPVAEVSQEPAPKTDIEKKRSAPVSSGLVAIEAKLPPRKSHARASKERGEYIRKSDWLRAQFLPEVEALDFSGLFVGNLGLGIREERGRRNVVLADPARITDVLLRGNGYRRSADHAKALICYQELVDMDSGNADFRFLLGKTLLELGQVEEAMQAFTRGKELGHEGAGKELENLRQAGHRSRSPLGFLRFWK